MGKATSEQILAIAAREIGYREGAGQRTKFGEWSGYNGQPWCMSFVQWVYHQAGADLPHMTASCGILLRWYQQNQPECIVKDPVPGCIVIFDWPGTSYDTDHTGLFVSKTATQITSIDGNTSGGNDSNGGWVQQRARAISYANPIYIVPKELNNEKEEDEDMTQETWNKHMANYLAELEKKDPTFEQDALIWGQQNGLMQGDASGRLMAKAFVTRGQFMVVLKRFYDKFFK